jgi:nitrite reductase (NO-forming)
MPTPFEGSKVPARTVAVSGLTVAIVALVTLPFLLVLSPRSTSPNAVREAAIIVPPPWVPPPIQRREAATVDVALETTEVRGVLASGVEYQFWRFNGSVPGPLIRVRVGDLVRVTLKNARNSANPHSINLHAVTGPGGGGELQVPPGGQGTFEWTALHAGLFVYHCMTPHVPVHIAQGMYGLILVEPGDGLPPANREYYLMQGEFYTKQPTLTPGFQDFDPVKAHADHPEYVVFNGRMDSLLDERALKARTGDVVRLFVGNGGPSLTSSFHVVGAVFDNVFENGAIGREPVRNSQMVSIAPGSSAIVDFRVRVPGRYFLVDHNYFRGHEKGTVAMLSVDGPAAPAIFHAPDATRTASH